MLLAGAAWTHAKADPPRRNGPARETALAIPRVRAPRGGPVGLPQPLRPSEAARIRRIYHLLARDRLTEAAAETRALGPSLLRGDLIAARLLHRPQQADADALGEWLRRWPDLPAAPAIRAILHARGVAEPLPTPPMAPADPPLPTSERPASSLPSHPMIEREVASRIAAGAFDAALRLIAGTGKLDALSAAGLRAEVARALFLAGHPRRALVLARSVLDGSEGAVGDAGFVGGLAAWKLGRRAEAAKLFARAWRAPLLPARLLSAAAYWAARAAEGDAAARPWLRRAAAEPDSFYGLLARRRLRDLLLRDVARGTLGEADAAAVDTTPEGHRAFAFLEVGQPEAAKTALLRLWPRTGGDPALRRAILLVALAADLPDLVIALAGDWTQDGEAHPRASPDPPHLQPRGGFVVSAALVYAVARVESGFDAAAISPQGARGMMQVMPATAAYVAGSAAASRIADPAVNLAVGQKYLLYLAGTDAADHDLLRVLVCYNDGPANAAKWMDEIDHPRDPLLFIEQIPLEETRQYVRRALAFAWTYAAHLDVAAPGLDALAAGEWPRLDGGSPAPARLH